jgi:H+-transporting ATPase
MIVILALLNDGAILSIAYDNVHYRNAPEAWNMRLVLGVSTVLGVLGVIAAFGLFYLGERVLHLDRAHIQTMMYLKLSVAGHLTIFLTRTRGPFWSIRPARILWGAVLGTQVLATCIAVLGLGLVTPLAWYWALLVWGWALAWFLVNDRAKLLTYWLLDRVRADEVPSTAVEPASTPKIAPKIAPETGPDTAPKTAPKAAPAPSAPPAPKPGANPPSQHHTASPPPAARPAPDPGQSPGSGNAKVTTLMDTKLGDLLPDSVLKDPASAGHFIAQAIEDAESSDAIAASPADKATVPAVPTPKAAA